MNKFIYVILLTLLCIFNANGQARTHLLPMSPNIPEDTLLTEYWKTFVTPKPILVRDTLRNTPSPEYNVKKEQEAILCEAVVFSNLPFALQVYYTIVPNQEKAYFFVCKKAIVDIWKNLHSHLSIPSNAIQNFRAEISKEDAILIDTLLQQALKTTHHPRTEYQTEAGAIIFWYKARLGDEFITAYSERENENKQHKDPISRLETIVLRIKNEFEKRPNDKKFSLSPGLKEEIKTLTTRFME